MGMEVDKTWMAVRQERWWGVIEGKRNGFWSGGGD